MGMVSQLDADGVVALNSKAKGPLVSLWLHQCLRSNAFEKWDVFETRNAESGNVALVESTKLQLRPEVISKENVEVQML